MSQVNRRSRHYFTEAARLAAMAKRREMALHPRDKMAVEVFVVRMAPASSAFTWELRRFGGIVLSRGEAALPSMRQAYQAGVTALSGFAPT